MEAAAFHFSLPVDARYLQRLRGALRTWLEAVAVAREERDGIVLAVHEAAMNAVEYADPETAVDVQALRKGDRVTVMVENEGGWREYIERGGGRGLPLMSALTSDMDITKDEGHIVVRLVVELGSPGG